MTRLKNCPHNIGGGRVGSADHNPQEQRIRKTMSEDNGGNGREPLETIEAKIRAAQARAREKRLDVYQLGRNRTFEGLRRREAGLLELDARYTFDLIAKEKAALLGVGRSTVFDIRKRIPDWDERVANRSREVVLEYAPEAVADLGRRLRDPDPDVRRQAAEQTYKLLGWISTGGVNVTMSQNQGQQAPALSADLLTAALSTLLQSLPDSDKMLIAKQLASGLSQTSHNNDYVNHTQLQLPEAVTVIDAQVVPQPVETRALDSPVVEQHGERRPGPLSSPQRDERGRFESPAVMVPVPALEPKAEDRAPTRGRGNDMKAARAALAAMRAAKKARLEARTAETPEGDNQPSTPPCDKAAMPDEP